MASNVKFIFTLLAISKNKTLILQQFTSTESSKCLMGSIHLYTLKSATPFPKCYLQKRNGLLIRKTAIKSSRPFHCAYHPLTP